MKQKHQPAGEHLTPDQIQRDKKGYSADRDYRGMVEGEKPTLQKEFDTRIQYHKKKGTELPKGIRKVY